MSYYKRNSFHKILFLSAVFFLSILLTFSAMAQEPSIPLSDEEKQWLVEHHVLRLGVGVAFPPFMWVEKKDGRPIFKGIVSDFVDLLGAKLGVDMQIVFDIPFNEALARGRTGRIDLFPCIAKTPERSEFLTFSEPYLSYPLVIITREDAPLVGGVTDLNGKKIAVVKHLFVYSKLKTDYSNLNLDYFYTEKVGENLEAVSVGQADACIINLAAASYYIQRKGLTNLRIAAPVEWQSVALSMGVRKDWPILQGIINKVLVSISQEEKDRISQHWIQVAYERGVDVGLIWRWSLGIGFGIAVLFAVVFAWNRRLQKEIIRRKMAEKAERENEIKYRTLFKSSVDALSILDFETGKFIDCNSAAVKLYDIGTRENFLGLTPYEISPEFQPSGEPSQKLAREHIRRAFAEGSDVFEWTHTRRNGTTFPVLVTLSAMKIGKSKSILAVTRDLTELKEALTEVTTLSGLLPICAACKKIRDDKGYWNQIEAYISQHSDADFSHSICPDCAKELYPDLDLEIG